ncbi:hypothetical protein QAD02_020922 [Eretmocerus hayati]|uniref:Uncharacterized protein n=1 Tax=Eretmocerus hayati TaxID=131215 RepID=A0ACC2PRB1_9HYME|nr:hypothetical protein QAD02_020922 [Eretmocerus hayati]
MGGNNDKQEQAERHRNIHREGPDLARERETGRKLIGFAKEQAGKGKKTLVRDTQAIIEGQIWRWNERENKPFQTGKEWRRTEPKERSKEDEDNSMEHSGRQKHQPQNMGIFERI